MHRLRQQEDKNQRLKKLVAIGQDRLPGRSQGIEEMLITAGLECKNGPPWRSVAMNLVPGLGLTPQALNSARVALAPKG
ncbi:hypothetical protein OA48_19385 [Klebsiella variicola]|nr:hypothetical protein OA48_19385 [Klebsiella variicola]